MLNALYIAIISVVVSEMLITDGNIFAFYGKMLERLPDVLSKPLGECPRCMAGQIALWSYLFLDDYNIIEHLIFVACSILFTELIVLIYGKLQV